MMSPVVLEDEGRRQVKGQGDRQGTQRKGGSEPEKCWGGGVDMINI